ncbi:uncharacterized protein LOC136711128 [Amia ocellicauda]|uniref:uncharacterized protein LOC136711128 n=1 Tax=Amia ocellicauda TaxID=2972642 RepID=UPI0034646F6A
MAAVLLLCVAPLIAGVWGRVVQDADFLPCNRFFYMQTPPAGFDGGQLVHICQTYEGTDYFATLYNASCRLPVYSAYVVTVRGQGAPDSGGLDDVFIEPQIDLGEAGSDNMMTEEEARSAIAEQLSADTQISAAEVDANEPEGLEEEEVIANEREEGDQEDGNVSLEAGVSGILQGFLPASDEDESELGDPESPQLPAETDAATYPGGAMQQGHLGGGQALKRDFTAYKTHYLSSPRLQNGEAKQATRTLTNAVPVSFTDDWDGTASNFVLDRTSQECASQGGSLYVISGARSTSPGVQERICLVDLVWTALCCHIPQNASASFALALVKEGDGQARFLDLQQLRGLIGGEGELFRDNCGEAEKGSEGGAGAGGGVERWQSSYRSAVEESRQEGDEEADEDSESRIVAALSSVLSTLYEIPKRGTGSLLEVAYEELGILASLPQQTGSLVSSLGGDLVQSTKSVARLTLKAGEVCASQAYSATSPLLGSLYAAVMESANGLGTLSSESISLALGLVTGTSSIAGDLLGRFWDSFSFFSTTIGGELVNNLATAGWGTTAVIGDVSEAVLDRVAAPALGAAVASVQGTVSSGGTILCAFLDILASVPLDSFNVGAAMLQGVVDTVSGTTSVVTDMGTPVLTTTGKVLGKICWTVFDVLFDGASSVGSGVASRVAGCFQWDAQEGSSVLESTESQD